MLKNPTCKEKMPKGRTYCAQEVIVCFRKIWYFIYMGRPVWQLLHKRSFKFILVLVLSLLAYNKFVYLAMTNFQLKIIEAKFWTFIQSY